MPNPQRSELQHWYRQAEQALGARDYQRAHRFCMSILGIDPAFAGAMFVLGMIALEHRNFSKAASVLERAIQLDPHDARFPAQLGRCLVALHHPREAMAAAHRALALQPEDALTLDTIGVVLSHAGAHEQALRPFELAVSRAPNQAAYHYNLGISLQFSGRFAEAETALRRALQLDATLFRAWTALSQVVRGPLPPEDVQKLQQTLEQASSPDAQLQLCHALAKHYEELRQPAHAFQLLQRGKRAKRQTLEYSSAVDAELFEAARQPWDAVSSRGHPSTEPIFIVGMPRTGTTLLERILAAHPQIFAAGELTNFALAVKRSTHTQVDRVLDPATLAAAHHLNLAQIGAEYIESTRPRTGHTPRFIDKMPLNFFFAGIIQRALPQARIICLRRNPLDTCLANYRQLFASDFPYYRYAYDLLDIGRYYVQFEALIQHWRVTLGARFCEVWYEDIVEDTEGVARRLLEFCGLQWDATCMGFHRSDQPVATASSVQVRQPVYKSSMGRWRDYRFELGPLRELLIANGVIPAAEPDPSPR
jgi:tetratricopeptide (TPR) repeat protein